MKEYFVSVIAVSLVGSLLVTLAPNGGVTKHIKLLCALCTVACIVFPLGTLFENSIRAEDIENAFDVHTEGENFYGEIYNEAINGYNILNAEETLKNEIIKELGLLSDAFDIKMVNEDKGGVIYISCVRVYLYSKGLSVDPRRIEDYVSKRLGCGCEFIYDVL